MKAKTDFIIKAVNIFIWIAFVGFCIQTGALIFTYTYSLFKPVVSSNLYLGLNLSEIYKESLWYYTCLVSLIVALSALKAFVFYLAIKIFMKIDMVKPFSSEVSKLISKISYYVFSIGILGYVSTEYAQKIVKKGIDINNVGEFWNDYNAYLLMAGLIFFIAQVFKKGIELQNENDLTI